MSEKEITGSPSIEEIGHFRILESLGKGGMGEVFLAIDPVFERKVALKRIRPDLQDNKTIQRRFLREAKVASSLNHPSIVPIFSIQTKPPEIYYTMPYVEGETLRQVLKKTKALEKNEQPPHPIGGSIPELSRIFLQVCEAVAYTHSKGILHRDLKPENIIIGKYGEVLILDWGIADFIENLNDEMLCEVKLKNDTEDLTKPGKITGTLAYMAPERLKGKSSSVQTDLYALGVILYQLLTLQLPFQRKTIATFRKTVDSEQIVDPTEAAPYREIPHPLAAICLKAIAKNPKDRFQNVESLIFELKKSIEGRPEWILAEELDLNQKDDWQLQENILLSKHLAITQNFDETQWAALSISKKSFFENLRMDAKIRMNKQGKGLGFLLNIANPNNVVSLEEGYLLWIGSSSQPGCKLFRSNVQVLEIPKLHLSPNTWHHIRIEKNGDHLKFYLNGELKLSFLSHLPLPGKYIGILAKDELFELQRLKIYDGSHNVTVSCMAVPNAFLSHKFFDIALEEYRRIRQCFPGRTEGREALFRAGLTLLEKGKSEKNHEKKEQYFHYALKEFEKLYRTPGAPFEYLGKSLVYEAMDDSEEEAKCLELGLRKFPKHPLLPVLKEHIIYRMHASSLTNRESAYRIILLSIRNIPNLMENPNSKALIDRLKENWEPLPFIEGEIKSTTEIAIVLSFWLAKVPLLSEIAKQLIEDFSNEEIAIYNILHCLLELEAIEEAEKIFKILPENSSKRKKCFEVALTAAKKPLNATLIQKAIPSPNLEPCEIRTLLYILRLALKKEDISLILILSKKIKLPLDQKLPFIALEFWGLMLDKKHDEAKNLFKKLPQTAFIQENSPLHFPYGCWLYAVHGPKKAFSHFGSALDTSYPLTTALPSHFLTGRINEKKGWIDRAFWWEKKELYRQIDLFYKTVGKHGKT